MNLREQFEKETGWNRPIEPYSVDRDAEAWSEILHYEEQYSDWLEHRNKEQVEILNNSLGILKWYDLHFPKHNLSKEIKEIEEQLNK